VSAPDAERALPDEVLQAAIRAGAEALINLGTFHMPTVSGGTALNLPAETFAQIVVDAAAHLLYAAGRASVLDEAREEWALRRTRTGTVIRGHSRESAHEYVEALGEPYYEAVTRRVIETEWQPAPGAGEGRTDG